MTLLTNQNDAAAHLENGVYESVDLGCSKGGSIEFAMKSLGVQRGIGVDLDPAKVKNARVARFEVLLADATKFAAHPLVVSFGTTIDFLEHLPGIQTADICNGRSGTSCASLSLGTAHQRWRRSRGKSLGIALYLMAADLQKSVFTDRERSHC
jgi:hypothetical protein